ncbi:MAG TPA: septum formation initiator family protein [Bryobacteraceae bacterium]|nr:septum formation initiator family protein [Bryobacteraceae bacterium]
MKRALILVAFALLGTLALRQLRGPEGLPSVREKWDELRQLEEQNAALQRENDYRRDRIKKLESNPSEQELEIRKKLKLLRPGETSFILPEQAKPAISDPAKNSDEARPELGSDSK